VLRLIAIGSRQAGRAHATPREKIYESQVQRRIDQNAHAPDAGIDDRIGVMVGGLIYRSMSAILSINELAFK